MKVYLILLQAKMDPLLKEKRKIDPNCESDPYFHTLMSISRKIRYTYIEILDPYVISADSHVDQYGTSRL